MARTRHLQSTAVTLSAGRGPLSKNPAGTFSSPVEPGVAYVEPHHRRVEAFIGGRKVIDTEHVLLIHRAGSPLSYLFRPSEVGDLPVEAEPEADGYVRVPWDAVDEWFEEGRKLVAYPPNPYHRVDCRPTKRRLTVRVGDAVLVDTEDTVILFETGLAPKLYVAPDHVRTDLLQPSDTVTYCNYKGYTTYYDAVVDGVTTKDVAWVYDEPLPESAPIKGYFSFEPTVCSVTAALPDPSDR